MIVVDTCVLIYDALEPHKLSDRARRLIAQGEASATIACSDVSLWEIAMLVERGRLDPGVDSLSFIQLVLKSRSMRVIPISAEIAARSASLGLHGEPADRIIVATAIESSARLLTPDRKLRAFPGVQAVW